MITPRHPPAQEFYRYYQQLKLEGLGEQETKLDLISKGLKSLKKPGIGVSGEGQGGSWEREVGALGTGLLGLERRG